MARKVPAVDYTLCRPEECAGGICTAALECEKGRLIQAEAGETPEVNPAKYCHSCTKCAKTCPLKAIKLIEQ
jgi:NAD-dependent dihydropyrimidine dehydrogenase PreA subunit